MLAGMPKGLAHERDRGMDGTRDWGRLYWGGALFWLLADVEIRELTSNQRSLADALRAVLAAGGNTEESWPIERFVETADRALPRPVLAPLYRRMGQSAMPVDLPALWRRLGVSLGAHGAVFDDQAPLAAVRRGITGR
jgi:predicted metalloprotease with PDZ domain